MTFKLAILLSTYNGERFISTQLDSLMIQTFHNFLIVARDDGSQDDTKRILEQYANQYPDRFYLCMENPNNLGVCASFSLLLEVVVTQKQKLGLSDLYIMFCDQDDFWVKNKVELQMQIMLDKEAKYPEVPILIHSDLEIVDSEGAIVANSFINYQGINPNRNRLTQLAIYNLVTGCTMLVNEVLAKKALPISKRALMHDWWLALFATAFGRRYFICTPMVRYRQHGENVIGAQKIESISNLGWRFMRDTLIRTPPSADLEAVANQAQAFYAQYLNQLSWDHRLGLWLCSLMRFRIRTLQRIIYCLVLALPRKK